jgi:uncharacterized protein (DUF1800 family)
MSQILSKPLRVKPFMRKLSLLPALLLLVSCGGGDSSRTANLSGQVSAVASNAGSKATHFAASRFLEQAAMGPSPASVAQVKAQGIEGWIATQMKLPPTKIVTPASLYEHELNTDKPAQQRMTDFYKVNLYSMLIGGEDQLRIRTSWVLSNFLVVSTRKIQDYGALEYLNMLQTNAFGQYGDLLKDVTRNPGMGFYLDNWNNRKSQLNENYGRELMQLFSVGLVQLNLNGTPKRDASGKLLETYTQKDVIEITRALTGWNNAEPEIKRSSANFANYGKPMVSSWPNEHDTGSKTLLGKTIPAGQDAYKDLDSLVEILVTHPNTAPFVSLRLIQGMTTSDPSPAYLERVATVFKNTKGNLAKVITAILTDPEARSGDAPNKATANFGRIKEPLLMHTSAYRGLGCKVAPRADWNPSTVRESGNQRPFNALSVFNFYPPNHRTQGTNVLAPEQKMLNSVEFSDRMSNFTYEFQNDSLLSSAGCDVEPFKAALAVSDEKLMDLINDRYFRGALPAAISKSLIDANKNYSNRNKGLSATGAILDMASITSAYGVSK